MAVVTRRLERGRDTSLQAKGQRKTAAKAWINWALGTGGMVLAAIATIHVLHRLGVEAVAGWDLVGSLIGYAG